MSLLKVELRAAQKCLHTEQAAQKKPKIVLVLEKVLRRGKSNNECIHYDVIWGRMSD